MIGKRMKQYRVYQSLSEMGIFMHKQKIICHILH